jgi:chloramphenicol-sensitive protein RarD
MQGVLAYGLWGVVAAYWKLLSHVGPVEVIAHRAVWGLGSFAVIVAVAGEWRALRSALTDAKLVGVMALSGFLLAINWGVFVWATTNGHLLDASLGYFINPLVSIALGTLVLRERLRRLQWIAITLAAIGVALLTWRATHGTRPARVDALVGSTIETLLLAPLAVIYLAVIGGGVAPTASASTIALLVGTGIVTIVPLVLFTSAARRLPLSTLGFLQYLAPTGQFLLAVLAFGEPLAHDRLLAFIWIWAGLAVFTIDLARQRVDRR